MSELGKIVLSECSVNNMHLEITRKFVAEAATKLGIPFWVATYSITKMGVWIVD